MKAFAGRLSVVVPIVLALSFATISPAAGQDFPSIPGFPSVSVVSGSYANTDAGVEIVFPGGWEGTEISTEGSVIASVYAGGADAAMSGEVGASMVLIIADKSHVQEPPTAQPPAMSEGAGPDCNVVSTTNIQAAGSTGVQTIADCTVEGQAMKMKSVLVDTQTRWIAVMFMAPSDEYGENVGHYDNSVGTLKVSGAIDAGRVGLQMRAIVQSVLIAGEAVQVDVRSSSAISNFMLDEASKRVSFTAEGEDGTQGETEILIGRVLEGPYTVTVDGEVTTNFKVTQDGGSGETMIRIFYGHSTREVAVTGTNVVPEFPAAAIIIAASVMGVAIFMTRTRLAGLFTNRMP